MENKFGLFKQKLVSLRERTIVYWYTRIHPKRKTFVSLFSLLVLTAAAGTGLLVVRNVQKTGVDATGSQLLLTSSNVNPKVGDQITVAVYIDTKWMMISAANIKLNFDQDVLEAVSIQNGNYLPTVLTPGGVSSGTAAITLGCLVNSLGAYPKKGDGILANVVFNVKSSAPTTISFDSSTAVAAVGQTVNAVGTLTPIQINNVQSPAASQSPIPTSSPINRFRPISSPRETFIPKWTFEPRPTLEPRPTFAPTLVPTATPATTIPTSTPSRFHRR